MSVENSCENGEALNCMSINDNFEWKREESGRRNDMDQVMSGLQDFPGTDGATSDLLTAMVLEPSYVTTKELVKIESLRSAIAQAQAMANDMEMDMDMDDASPLDHFAGMDIDVVSPFVQAKSQAYLNQITYLAASTSNLEMTSPLLTNNMHRQDNCFWVCIAHIFKCPVSEVLQWLGVGASTGLATTEVILEAIEKLRQGCNSRKMALDITVAWGHVPEIPHWAALVAYKRADGFGHCVLKEHNRFVCYQNSDEGQDLTALVKAPDSLVVLTCLFL